MTVIEHKKIEVISEDSFKTDDDLKILDQTLLDKKESPKVQQEEEQK